MKLDNKYMTRTVRNGCNGNINNNNIKTVKFSQDIEMDEMSEKFLSKFGVRDIDDIIENVSQRDIDGGKQFIDHITSCNKVIINNSTTGCPKKRFPCFN